MLSWYECSWLKFQNITVQDLGLTTVLHYTVCALGLQCISRWWYSTTCNSTLAQYTVVHRLEVLSYFNRIPVSEQV